MSQEWDADVDLTEAQARGLIEAQFPDLAPAGLELLGVGWDNAAYRVNGEWVFRFPRRELGARLTEREVGVLPRLAPHLPLPVPEPTRVGSPAGGYPYVFAGYRLIPGVTACGVQWSEEERARCAGPLARFLKALHGIPVEERDLAEGPRDDLERWNMRKRLPMLRERLFRCHEKWEGVAGGEEEWRRGREDGLGQFLASVSLEAVLGLAERLAETPPHAGRPCWVHGDLYPRHLLVDELRRPCGVIDWGDVHLGDPALDLSLAFTFLPEWAREGFRREYGAVEGETWVRARFRALFYGVVLTHYGLEAGDAAMARTGVYALRSAWEAG